MLTRPAVLALAVALAAASALAAQTPSAPVTRSLQGDSRAWTQNPHLHQVWERLRIVCAQGCEKADAAAFDRDAIAQMRQMAPALGMSPDAMAGHVKAIPRQMLKIAQEDPAVLADYDAFVIALVGPP